MLGGGGAYKVEYDTATCPTQNILHYRHIDCPASMTACVVLWKYQMNCSSVSLFLSPITWRATTLLPALMLKVNAQVWMPIVPPAHTNTHHHKLTQQICMSQTPLACSPCCWQTLKRTEGFQEPWYRRVHYAQLCTGVQPRQSGIVESFHACRVSERLYLVFY